MFEIEMKFRMPENRQHLADQLVELRAERGGREQHSDHYFDHPGRSFVETGEALRLRKIDGVPYVTYKGPKELCSPSGSSMAVKVREELEWCLAPGDLDGEKMERLLVSLGFVSVAEVAKARVPYEVIFRGQRLLVVLDSVRSLGEFVEVECLVESGQDRVGAIAAVEALARFLGCSVHEPRSYLRMIIESGVQ